MVEEDVATLPSISRPTPPPLPEDVLGSEAGELTEVPLAAPPGRSAFRSAAADAPLIAFDSETSLHTSASPTCPHMSGVVRVVGGSNPMMAENITERKTYNLTHRLTFMPHRLTCMSNGVTATRVLTIQSAPLDWEGSQEKVNSF